MVARAPLRGAIGAIYSLAFACTGCCRKAELRFVRVHNWTHADAWRSFIFWDAFVVSAHGSRAVLRDKVAEWNKETCESICAAVGLKLLLYIAFIYFNSLA